MLALSLIASPAFAAPKSAAERRAIHGVVPETALGRELGAVVDVSRQDGQIEGRRFVLARVLKVGADAAGDPVSEVELLDVRIEPDPQRVEERVSGAALLPLLGVFAFFVPLRVQVETGKDLDRGQVTLIRTGIGARVRGLLPQGKNVGLWVQRDPSGLLAPMLSVDSGWQQTPRRLDAAMVPSTFRAQSIQAITQALQFPNEPEVRVAAWTKAISKWEAQGGVTPAAARAALAIARLEQGGEALPSSVFEAAEAEVRAQLDGEFGVPALDLLSLARMQAHSGKLNEATDTFLLARAELPPHAHIDVEIAGVAVRAERWDDAATTLALPLAEDHALARSLCARMRRSAPEAAEPLCPVQVVDERSSAGFQDGLTDLLDAEAEEEPADAGEEVGPDERPEVVGPGQPVVLRSRDGMVRRVEMRLTGEAGTTLRLQVDLQDPLYGKVLRVALNPTGASWTHVTMLQVAAEPSRYVGTLPMRPRQEGRAFVYVEVLKTPRGPVLDAVGSEDRPIPVEIALP